MLSLLLAAADSHTAAAPDESVGLPLILGVLAAIALVLGLLWFVLLRTGRASKGPARSPRRESAEPRS